MTAPLRLPRRIRPHQAKILRDLWTTRGRVAVMIAAIAIALTGVGAMLAAKTIIASESTDAYRQTNPASAALDVEGGVDADLLAAVRQRPGIVDATARQTITTRVRVDDQWYRMLLFVVDPSDPMRIARFRVESGAWPTPDDGLLVERAAAPLLSVRDGGSLRVAGPDGAIRPLRVTGEVYDPALAPAPQERTGYGYLTPAAAARLGFRPTAEDLRILVGDRSTGRVDRDQRTVDATAAETAAWLAASGHPVHQVSAPPYRHPHSNQASTITTLFLAFAFAALLLAGVLVASTLGNLLAAQTRQIAIMKTIGATSGRILRMYLGATIVIAATATLLSVVPALAAGYGLARIVCDLLNVDMVGVTVPVWVFLVLAAAGIGVPVAVALVPLRRAAGLSVRQALDDHGVATAATAPKRFGSWLARTRLGGRTATLAVRNLGRRRTRLALTLALLAAGGALFTAGLNTARAWQQWVDDGLARRSYTAEIQLVDPVPQERIRSALRDVGAVTSVETLRVVPASPAGAGQAPQVRRVYPDGGHGRFNLVAIAPDTTMVDFEVLHGRWLRPGDTTAAVLNQVSVTRLGHPGVGDDVHVYADGRVATWHVVGIVAEVGGSANVYTSSDALNSDRAASDTAASGSPAAGSPAAGSPASDRPASGGDTRSGLASTVRFTATGDARDAAGNVERALAAAGIPAASTTLTSDLRTAIDQHVVIFIYTLIALAILMACVGLLGLASTMTIAVTERTREYGVMQTLGATPSVIRRMVLTEGAITGLLGCVVALGLSIPLSKLVGSVLGRLSFELPLPLTISHLGTVLWAALALAGAVTASLAAATRASRLTIRETLSHQ